MYELATHPYTNLSLCSGVGGMDLGLQRAGFRTVCYVEQDEYRIQTLIARMQEGCLDHAPIWDDISSFDGRPWCGRISLLSAGFPCQPFSVAGSMRGADDERYVWPHIYRLICEVRPSYILLENVPGILMAKRGRAAPLSTVLSDLASIGYDAQWDVLSAAAFGAPHLRRRVFVVAYPYQKRWYHLFQDDVQRSICLYPLWQTSEPMVLLPDRVRQLEQGLSEPSVRGDDDGTAYRVERLAAVGDAVVPQVAEYVGRCIQRHARALSTDHVAREELRHVHS